MSQAWWKEAVIYQVFSFVLIMNEVFDVDCNLRFTPRHSLIPMGMDGEISKVSRRSLII